MAICRSSSYCREDAVPFLVLLPSSRPLIEMGWRSLPRIDELVTADLTDQVLDDLFLALVGPFLVQQRTI